MTISVGANSWVSEADADIFFASRPGAEMYWVSGANKAGYLLMAYRWLKNCRAFTFPTIPNTFLAELQCEYTLFLMRDLAGIETRMDLQGQGVTKAGILREEYGKLPFGIPISQFIVAMIPNEYKSDAPFYIIDVERNENESVGYNAPGDMDI